jgi:hypothetical protein
VPRQLRPSLLTLIRPRRALRRPAGATRATAPRRPSGGVGPTGPGRSATRVDCVSLAAFSMGRPLTMLADYAKLTRKLGANKVAMANGGVRPRGPNPQ